MCYAAVCAAARACDRTDAGRPCLAGAMLRGSAGKAVCRGPIGHFATEHRGLFCKCSGMTSLKAQGWAKIFFFFFFFRSPVVGEGSWA